MKRLIFLKGVKMIFYEVLISIVNERESIRLRKERGALSLTNDPIFAKYRFCNVRRKHDRVSKWLLDNYYKCTTGDVWFRALIARLINWPPTLIKLMEYNAIPHTVEEFDAKLFLNAMKDLEQLKQKTYSSAYIVYPTRMKGNTKAYNLCNYIITPTIEIKDEIRKQVESKSIENVTTALATSFGIQTFIAGQVAADLSYIKDQLDDATDLFTWAPMGPGSIRGLNRLHYRYLKDKITQEKFNSELLDIRNALIGSNADLKDITLHDVQNVMCEYDKYMRAYLTQGAPRQLYKPEKAF
jgi:hypothetical protein